MKKAAYLVYTLIFLLSCQMKNKFEIQGHRGARGLHPENTIPAFEKALNLGVTTIELDVVVSKDKKLVVSHEPFFNPLICLDPSGNAIDTASENQHNIYQLTYAEIQKYDCGSIGNAKFPEQIKQKVSKPTLSESISFIENYIDENNLKPVLYNIETKCTPQTDGLFHPGPDEFAELLYQEVKKAGILDRVCFQSFDVRTLQYLKKKEENLTLALLVENELGFHRNIEMLGFQPTIYSPYYKLINENLILKCQDKGIRIIPWTINEINDMQRMKDMGVDGIITDYPDRALRAFK